MLTALLDFIFPKHCVGCNKVGTYFCEDCIKEIKQTDLICPICERMSLGGVTHPLCKKKFGLDGLWSLGAYKEPLREAIQKLKYKYVTDFSKELINILIEYWAKNPPILLDLIKKDRGENWLIVPVPLHKARQNWRGFNQAALLGKLLANKLGLEYKEVLKRVKNTTPQMSLKAHERKKNIKDAFSLFSTMNHEPLTHNILLIDDVWTTGSTLKECCYVLKRGGAKTVWALTLAK